MKTLPKKNNSCQYASKCKGNFTSSPKDNPSPGGGDSLLYLYSNNSTEIDSGLSKYSLICALQNVLSSYHKRQAETLHLNVSRLIESAPSINHIGFLTLTFKDNVTDPKEAYNRFRSFNSHFLAPSPDFGDWICVKEPQKRGAWHYHLIVVLKHDIRSSFDFEQYLYYEDQVVNGMPSLEIKRLRRLAVQSASPELRRYWSSLRLNLSRYRFGRSELLPIRTNKDAMAYYIGKYISKAIDARSESSKGVRLISYSRSWVKNSVNFQWHTEGSQLWRKKLQLFAAMNGCESFYHLTDKLGTGWAYKHADTIFNLPGPDEIGGFDNLVAQFNFLAKEHKPTDHLLERIENWKKHKNQINYNRIAQHLPNEAVTRSPYLPYNGESWHSYQQRIKGVHQNERKHPARNSNIT